MNQGTIFWLIFASSILIIMAFRLVERLAEMKYGDRQSDSDSSRASSNESSSTWKNKVTRIKVTRIQDEDEQGEETT